MNTTDQPTPAPEHAPTESDNKLAAQIFGFAHSKDFADGHKIPALIAQHVSAAVATATAELKANRDQWFSNYTESARTLMELRADLATAQRQLVEAEAAAFSVCSTLASQLATSQAVEKRLRDALTKVVAIQESCALEVSEQDWIDIRAALAPPAVQPDDREQFREQLRKRGPFIAHFCEKGFWTVQNGPGWICEFPNYRDETDHKTASDWAHRVCDLLNAQVAPSAGGGGETEKTRLYNELVVPEASRAAAGATPRTDDQILTGTNRLDDGEYVRADFARTLERELTASSAVGQRDYDGMREFQAKFVVASQELTALRAERDALVKIVDASFDVAVFSKTHAWPKETAPEFFEFAQKLDVLATAINARYPNFNRNVQRDAKLTDAIDAARKTQEAKP